MRRGGPDLVKPLTLTLNQIEIQPMKRELMTFHCEGCTIGRTCRNGWGVAVLNLGPFFSPTDAF